MIRHADPLAHGSLGTCAEKQITCPRFSLFLPRLWETFARNGDVRPVPLFCLSLAPQDAFRTSVGFRPGKVAIYFPRSSRHHLSPVQAMERNILAQPYSSGAGRWEMIDRSARPTGPTVSAPGTYPADFGPLFFTALKRLATPTALAVSIVHRHE